MFVRERPPVFVSEGPSVFRGDERVRWHGSSSGEVNRCTTKAHLETLVWCVGVCACVCVPEPLFVLECISACVSVCGCKRDQVIVMCWQGKHGSILGTVVPWSEGVCFNATG